MTDNTRSPNSLSSLNSPQTTHSRRHRAGAWLTLIAFLGQTTAPLAAGIVADAAAPATQRPTVLNAANGVPQINIQTPSAAGVSRNTYSQFNVAAQGVILNNSRSNVQTQLGGFVQGNPWLAAGAAKVILNEVNSANPSLLQGYLEVAGTRAQVVVANPSGVTCDGCGFINANRATLTTGTPIVNGGSLEGYRVQRGQISVQGNGLDASQTDYTDLIARAVQVNAGIWAKDLKVTTGTQQVDVANIAAHTTHTPIAGSGTAPAYAVDVAQLGGMYAGKITLVGTEAGLGVRNAGHIGASAGDVVLRVDGRLENLGRVNASGALDVATAGHALDNTGTLAAGGAVRIASGVLRNDAALIQAGGTLHIDTGSADLVNSRSGVPAQGGGIIAVGDLNVRTGNLDNRDGAIGTQGRLDLIAQRVDNRNGALQSLGASAVNLSGALDNRDGILRADGDVELQTPATLDNSRGRIVAGGVLRVRDPQSLSAPASQTLLITHTDGQLLAGTGLEIDAKGLSGDGELLSNANARLALRDDFIHAGTNVRLIASGDLALSSAGRIDNRALIQAGGQMQLTATDLDNAAAGEILAGELALDITGTLNNRGLIDGIDARVFATTLNNLGGGRIYGDTLALAATTLTNTAETVGGVTQAPAIAARQRLDLAVGTLNNEDGAFIHSDGDIAIGGALDGSHRATGRAGTLNNLGADIEAMGALDIVADQLHNTRRSLTIRRDYLDSSTVNSQICRDADGGCDYISHITQTTTRYQDNVIASTPAATLRAGGNARLDIATLTNRHSQIQAGGDLDLNGHTLTNEGTELYRQTDTVTSDHLIHWGDRDHGTTIRANSSSTLIGSVPATLSAGGNLTGSYSGRIDNTSIRQHHAPDVAPSGIQIGNLDGAALTQVAGSTAGQVVRTIAPGPLPGSALYRTLPFGSTQPYLIETDPRYADRHQWLGSDYLLAGLGLDPAATHKRLGDGQVEQRLVQEQIAQLTGRRFLDGYRNDEAQYLALMDAGLAYAQAWQLVPGVALSAAQMAQLTQDIVWLVSQEVTLPDGRRTTALVPQVYARLDKTDLAPGGALMAGRDLSLASQDDLQSSGALNARQRLSLAAENLTLAGDLTAGRADILARQDLTGSGARLTTTGDLSLAVGRDLSLASHTGSTDVRGTGRADHVASTRIDRTATLAAGGKLTLSAGRDLALNAVAASSGGDTTLAAGRDLTLGTVTETTQSHTKTQRTQRDQASRTDVGGALVSQGDLTLLASRDLTATAAQAISAGDLVAQAGQDLTINAGQASSESHYQKQSNRSGFLSSKRSSRQDDVSDTRAIGSSFSGATLDLSAGRDLSLIGSQAVSDNGTRLSAGRDVRLATAQETHSETHAKQSSRSGLFTSGGSLTLGKQTLAQNASSDQTFAVGSTVGSVRGDVTIQAGQGYRQSGSDVLAPSGDIAIAAQTIRIDEARETSRTTQKTKASQSGLSLNVSSPIIDAMQSLQQMKQAASQTGDARMQALAAANAALSATDALHSAQAIAANPSQVVSAINVSISLGASKSQSGSSQTSATAQGSTVAAGGNLSLHARGAGQASDIVVQGSRLGAGQDLALIADGDIQLLAAKSTAEQHSQNRSNSASVGIGFALGGQQNGFTLNAGASQARGHADGADTTWTHTQVGAGGTAILVAGADAALKGASVSGQRVIADVGGNLAIESLQDTSTYESKQKNASVGVSLCIPPFCYGTSGSVSVGKSGAESDYASVREQAGIRAGDGGFQVRVGGDTALVGAVISSSDKAIQASRNSLTTGTLATRDIENQANASADSSGINMSSDMFTQGKYGIAKGTISNALDSASESGSSNGKTRSAVSGGAILITDESSQRELTGQTAAEMVASLNRDTANAHTAVTKQDVQAMRRTVGAERVIKQEAVKQLTMLTDESYRVMFKETPAFYRVTCPAGANCTANPELARTELVTGTPEEVQAELAMADKGAVIAVNGIDNPLERAGQLAMQNAELVTVDANGQTLDQPEKPTTVYLMHYIPANNGISELMIAAYEKMLAPTFGYTNQDIAYAGALQARGDMATVSLGHSRGTIVQTNANNILADQGFTNSNLSFRAVGGAVGVREFTDAAARVINDPEQNKNITYSYFKNDPVPVATGGNPGVLSLSEFWQVLQTSNSAHSCYGTGAAGCRQVEILTPNAPSRAAQDNSQLIRFRGGQQIDANNKPVSTQK